MAKSKNDGDLSMDDFTFAVLSADPEFQKFVADKVKDGTLPLLDKNQPAPAQPKGAATPTPEAKKTGTDKSVFFKGNEGEIKGIDSEEKFKAIIKEKFGIETDKGYDTLLNSTQKWREGATKGADAEKKLQGLDKALKSLPPVLRIGMSEFSNGRDWKKAIQDNLSKLDYNVPVDNYKKEDLAGHYFTNKVADAKTKLADKKIDQDAYDTLIDTFHTAAISKFTAEKSEFDAARNEIIKQQDLDLQIQRKSVDTTISTLKEKYPDFDDKVLTEVKTHLEGNLLSLFVNDDGTFKEDAGVKLALALFGEQEIASQVGDARKDAITDVNLEIIDTANKKPPISSGGGKPEFESVDPETKQILEYLGGGGAQRRY
jgi:hypothetical protein